MYRGSLGIWDLMTDQAVKAYMPSFGISKGRKAIYMERKKQIFAGPFLTIGYKDDSDQTGLARFLSSTY